MLVDLTKPLPNIIPSIAFELNFIAQQLAKLDYDDLHNIYEGLHGEQVMSPTSPFGKVVNRVFEIIAWANEEGNVEFTEAFNEALNAPMDVYLLTDGRAKLHLIMRFLFQYMKKNPDGSFEFGQFDLEDTTKVHFSASTPSR